MPTRHIYLSRHGDADPFGELTVTGRAQARLLGERLASLPIDAVWHSPLPRAATTAHIVAAGLADGTPVAAAPELVDHVPYVPRTHELPKPWIPFFDGYDDEEAIAGRQIAESLTTRFTAPLGGDADTHELLITHAYPIAWLIRDALRAPASAWLGLESANAALTVIEYRSQVPPALVMFNDMTHLPSVLRWSGFPDTARP